MKTRTAAAALFLVALPVLSSCLPALVSAAMLLSLGHGMCEAASGAQPGKSAQRPG